jgi:hypothetical protein
MPKKGEPLSEQHKARIKDALTNNQKNLQHLARLLLKVQDRCPWLKRKNWIIKDLPNYQKYKRIHGHIYVTTFENGKIYVGQCCCKLNSSAEKAYFGSGSLYQEAENKYGKHTLNKEILWLCYDLEEYNLVEEYFIWKLDACNKKIGYNILPTSANWHQGGINPTSLPEVRAKISKAKTGKKHTEQAKINMGLSHIGSKRRVGTKRKMSNAMQGNTNTTGLKYSTERLEKHKVSSKNGWNTRRNNKKKFHCVKQTKHRGWRMCICVDKIKYILYFETAIEAAEAYNELAIIAFGPNAKLNKIPPKEDI